MPKGACTTKAEAVAERLERLKWFGEKPAGQNSWPGLDPETENLIRSNPFAFLVAVAFDRGMRWQTAWQIPAEIDRKGFLDPGRLQWHSFSGGGLRYRFARLENGRASHFFLLGLQRLSGRRETRG